MPLTRCQLCGIWSGMEQFKTLLVGLAALAFAASPLMSDGFGGFRADQFAVPQVNAPIVPAGYAFSIWGLIYVWLIAGAAFGLLRRKEDSDWGAMRLPLALSLGVGAAWIPVAQQSAFWATVMIWIMWAGAVAALILAGRNDRVWQRSPVALYAGWLTAASVVALALVLAGNGVLDMQWAAVLGIPLALVIAVLVQRRRPDSPEYSAAVIWALTGIVVANLEPLNTPVAGLAAAGIIALASLAWWTGPRAA